MARYIVSRQPEDTRPNVTDWAEFAKKASLASPKGICDVLTFLVPLEICCGLCRTLSWIREQDRYDGT